MKLADWLTMKEMGFADFGEVIGRSAEAVRRYAKGHRIPDRETMPLIVGATGGAVTANDFFDLNHGAVDTPAVAIASSGIDTKLSPVAVTHG